MSEEENIEIDGSMMEGGGQILRICVSLATLLNKRVKINNIRAGRSTPGLRPQHLAGLRLVSDIAGGKLVGGEVGSTKISFTPGLIHGGTYFADTRTAGSIVLLLQVSLPCLLFADSPSQLDLSGGTNAEMAPQIDHTLMVFKPILQKFGADFSCEILKRGYFPKGGGRVKFGVCPMLSPLQAIEMLHAGPLSSVEGKSFVAGVLPLKVSHTMADTACQILLETFPLVSTHVDRIKEQQAEGTGAGIVLVGRTEKGCLLGGSALGKRGIPAEEVGKRAAKEVIDSASIGACVDSFVQDQLIIFMALAKGKSRVRVGAPTLHTKTAIKVVEMMTNAKFTISQDETIDSWVIECDGIGLERYCQKL